MKYIKYNQILQKIFCLICIGLFDFSRSDLSFMPVTEFSVTERWLVSIAEPSRSTEPPNQAEGAVHFFSFFVVRMCTRHLPNSNFNSLLLFLIISIFAYIEDKTNINRKSINTRNRKRLSKDI